MPVRAAHILSAETDHRASETQRVAVVVGEFRHFKRGAEILPGQTIGRGAELQLLVIDFRAEEGSIPVVDGDLAVEQLIVDSVVAQHDAEHFAPVLVVCDAEVVMLPGIVVANESGHLREVIGLELDARLNHAAEAGQPLRDQALVKKG